ncbi:MAG: ATP-binding protein [Planctomycetota bacterium]|nr:ATP-binding protein [Planctomycetota bacterium]
MPSLPENFPAWAKELNDAYVSGTSCLFLLHGNVFDLIHSPHHKDGEYLPVADFLARQIFGRWDLVMNYDLSRGLRPLAGPDSQRLREMVHEINSQFGDLKGLPRDPGNVLNLLDQFLEKQLVNSSNSRPLSSALIVQFSQFIAPSTRGSASQNAANLVTLLNWAQDNYLKRINVAVILIAEKLSDLNPRLIRNPHIESIEIPFPDECERKQFIESTHTKGELESHSDYTAEQLARLSAGLTLRNFEVLLRQAEHAGRRIDEDRFRSFKKDMIERECQGFLEFQEPSLKLDMVVGHEQAKVRLKEDADLLRKGHLNAVPMGYLICGPVGTGKSFLTECYAGTVGLPVVKLLNFRSKYVGETEGNLEKILRVLRAMGPVAVVIDEADAAVGDRDQGGDSGTASRVFSMLAAQMGDTKYRGRILWFLLTCRPDLLPVDIKRQGRAEVHIPLFYPDDEKEIRQMFEVQAKKLEAKLAEDAIPDLTAESKLSGADIEGIVTRAWRMSLLNGESELNRETLQSSLDSFIATGDDPEKEMQEKIAILECTDSYFLPERLRKEAGNPAFRTKLKNEIQDLRMRVEG